MQLTLAHTAALAYSPAEWDIYRADLDAIARDFTPLELAPTFAVFPRAAADRIQHALRGIAVNDLRGDRRHDYPQLAVEFFPASYDLPAAVRHGGGFFFFAPQSFPRTLANLARNLAFASGQFVTILHENPLDFARRARAVHPDFDRYACVADVVAAAPHGGAEPSAGIALLCLSAAAAEDQKADCITASPALARFVVASPSHAILKRCAALAPHIGAVVHNSTAAAPCNVTPVQLPFNNPVRASASRAMRLSHHESIFAMAEDPRRNDAITDLVLRTHQRRSLVLVEFIAQAGPLVAPLAHINPRVLLPREHAAAADRNALLADLAAPTALSEPICLFATFADAADLADALPSFDTCYHLTPTTAKLRLPASAPAMRRAVADPTFNDVRRLFVADDVNIPEFSRAVASFLDNLRERPMFFLFNPDRRYTF
jgi:hypothetical protein